MIMDKNEVKFEVIAFLVLFATLALTTVGCASAAETHYVNPGESIQTAVDNANAGDTIIVRDGTYTENVDVNVNHLTIKSENGADSTIVQAANTSDNVFAVTANYVNISGFTVKNATENYKVGIYLGSSADHCNISYNNATRNHFGIRLYSSSDNMLVNNIANSNNYGIGIYLDLSSDNMLVNNIANSNNYGIYLDLSSDNMLVNNTANSNNKYGIALSSSSNNKLTNNTMSGNKYNIDIDGSYTHDIDTSNLVDGKPIYYWVNQQDQQVPNDAGFVGLVKSTNITVKDLTLTMNGKGVLLIDTTDSRIENVNASNNLDGIHLSSSSNNTLVNNTANSNSNDGIHLSSSSNNTLVNNTANSNSNDGIHLKHSSNNTLVNNTANSNSNDGVYLYASGRNTLTGNTANSNRGNGIYLYATPTKNNTLTNNTANSNLDCGIYLWFSGKNNTLANNTVNSNSDYGICLKSSSDNRIYNNYLNNRNNAYDEGNNTWNIAKTDGTNIIGGSWLGGNYWSDYTGEDSDGDGLGNTLLPYNSSGDIKNGGDWLPLVKPSAP